MNRIVIVGASVAGVHAAEALRDQGFDGDVTLVSAEDTLPYDRPPLSKEALAGKVGEQDLLLRPSGWYAEQGIELMLGQPARQVDVRGGSVLLAGGASLGYDGLVLATGSAARRLDSISGDTARIHLMRTARDCVRLRERLIPGSRLLVIGAGFIGLEVAATARELGVEVTIVEIGPAPLAAVLGTQVGNWFQRLHEQRGVSIRCGQSVRAIETVGDGSRVHLAGGDVIDADAIVAGVGAAPATRWLQGSGIEMSDGGVACDERLHASAPGVVAAGDIACWYNPLFDEHIRVEHWTNAVEQGRFAALSLLGVSDASYVGPPYFWTDQFTAGTRTVGRISGADRVCVRHADDNSLVALYGRGNVLRAAVCVNSPRALIACRRAIMQRAPWQDALAAV
ncbi:NAD(P)/FAD-dependent oxidoreductase [Sphaerimonospora cavernae]|uniref:NAD(P)/FAD-dependent oxidoreductase n=1 Tax=Sphaerimonospora cavernae TaxID=1740611 RepID=A0ABV6U1K5_9ACTN